MPNAPARSLRPDRLIRQFLRRTRVRLQPGGATILDIYDHVDGFLALREAEFLYRAARGMRTIVEIGSFRGKSTCLLALGSADVGGHVHAIDPHINVANHEPGLYDSADHQALVGYTQRYGVASRVTPIVKLSNDARKDWGQTPIDLLWIDGDHTYEGARDDFTNWPGLVRPGGLIAGHDHSGNWPGVVKAWREFLDRDQRVAEHGVTQTICWARLKA
jgi:predicted O-methyltransferase YrrM